MNHWHTEPINKWKLKVLIGLVPISQSCLILPNLPCHETRKAATNSSHDSASGHAALTTNTMNQHLKTIKATTWTSNPISHENHTCMAKEPKHSCPSCHHAKTRCRSLQKQKLEICEKQHFERNLLQVVKWQNHSFLLIHWLSRVDWFIVAVSTWVRWNATC